MKLSNGASFEYVMLSGRLLCVCVCVCWRVKQGRPCVLYSVTLER